MGANVNSGPSFLDSLKNKNLIEKNMVSFSLGHYGDNPSSMIFGGYDTNLYVGDIAWNNLVTDHWWALDLRGIYYGDKTV